MLNVQVDFSQLSAGLAMAFTNKDSVYSNPNLKIILVGTDAMLKIGNEAVKSQEQYGQIDIPLFSTMDEAREYALRNSPKPRVS